MTKNKFIIIVSVFILLLVGVVLLFVFKEPVEEPEIIKRSEEYLKYDKMFDFELSSDGSYYSITMLEEKYQNEHTIFIPNTIDNIPVKKLIGDNGNFSSWKNVAVIEIPANIEYIGTQKNDEGILNGGTLGDSAFTAYNSATLWINVSNENKVYSSNEGILFNKDQTVLIRLPNKKIINSGFTVPESVITIYEKAFYMNNNLLSITLSNNLENIGAYAFYRCEKINLINFNENLKAIGDAAFNGCSLQNIILPNKLEKLGFNSFAYNETLQDIFIPSSVVEFGSSILTGCNKSVKVYTSVENLENLKAHQDSFLGKEIIGIE